MTTCSKALNPSAAPNACDIALLEELANLGMRLARKITETAESEPVDLDAAGLTFERVSRSVRLSLMLKDRLAKDAPQAANPDDERKLKVGRIMARIIEREHRGERAERLAAERLDRDFCGDVLDRPVSELIALICEDLDLDPDWPRLAAEAWAKQEMTGPVVGWPLIPFAADNAAGGEDASPPAHDTS